MLEEADIQPRDMFDPLSDTESDEEKSECQVQFAFLCSCRLLASNWLWLTEC